MEYYLQKNTIICSSMSELQGHFGKINKPGAKKTNIHGTSI
jgi:hypothetical protein